MIPKTLNTLPKGHKAVVQGVCSANRKLCSKLLSMGIVSGTLIEVLAIAPLGDPMEVRAKGYNLSLRKSEAAGIQVFPEESTFPKVA